MTSAVGLRSGVRLVHSALRGQSALLFPEGVLLLNETAAAVLRECDGLRDAEAVTAALAERYQGVDGGEVRALLADLVARRLVVLDGTGRPVAEQHVSAAAPAPVRAGVPAPLGLLAELTYRCPLSCGYCSNPLNLADYRQELATEDWLRVLSQARDLGVLQLHLSGGEPLLRRDLAELIAHAHLLGLYTNLITSGIPLDAERVETLAAAGLDHVQLSVQDADTHGADAVAGLPAAHRRKLAAAELITRQGLPLTVNAVLHRGNLARVGAIADLAVALGASRLELAHTQFYGWAWRNRAALMPGQEQVDRAAEAVAAARERYGDRLEIIHVAADYRSGTVKPCMNGWGSRQLVIAPTGDVLPCLAAAQLPGLEPPNVRALGLTAAWYDSPAFNRYRGTAWMPEPCRSCELRELDHGGCRCQAFQLTGDQAATDPACSLSPRHQLVLDAAAPVVVPAMVPRRMR